MTGEQMTLLHLEDELCGAELLGDPDVTAAAKMAIRALHACDPLGEVTVGWEDRERWKLPCLSVFHPRKGRDA